MYYNFNEYDCQGLSRSQPRTNCHGGTRRVFWIERAANSALRMQRLGWIEPTGAAQSGRPDGGLRETVIFLPSPTRALSILAGMKTRQIHFDLLDDVIPMAGLHLSVQLHSRIPGTVGAF